jgi:putative membrane protein
VYFGVPLSNFVGWLVLGAVGTAGYALVIGRHDPLAAGGFDRHGRRVWPGIALYYAVLAFNLVVTGWIGEWLLLMAGAALHVVTAAVLLNIGLRPATRLGLEKQRA